MNSFQLGITNLQKIFVQYCKIRSIDAEAFNKLTNLVELDLGENLIQVLISFLLSEKLIVCSSQNKFAGGSVRGISTHESANETQFIR